MGKDKMREEFEAWHKAEVANFVSVGQVEAACVLNDFKQTALAIWEASRAAVVVELPEGLTLEELHFGTKPDPNHERWITRPGATKAIEAAGLKVKP